MSNNMTTKAALRNIIAKLVIRWCNPLDDNKALNASVDQAVTKIEDLYKEKPSDRIKLLEYANKLQAEIAQYKSGEEYECIHCGEFDDTIDPWKHCKKHPAKIALEKITYSTNRGDRDIAKQALACQK